jgi:hypothetical protein
MGWDNQPENLQSSWMPLPTFLTMEMGRVEPIYADKTGKE